jgi:hypothetical protein
MQIVRIIFFNIAIIAQTSSVLITKYYSGDQNKKNEVGGACSTYGGGERCIQDFGGPEVRRPLGRPRRRWEDNIKMDVQEVGWGAWPGLI